MDRRRFLSVVPGLAVGARLGPELFVPRLRRRRRIAVAGGGIIGSSIACHLARRGAEVTLLEKEEPGAGATSRSFAWINSNAGKQPWEYNLLNRLGVYAYRLLEEEVGEALGIRWDGSVQWAVEADAAESLRDQVKRQREWGYAVRLLEREELRALEPRVSPGAFLAGVHWREEGSVDPVHVTELFLRLARAAGARTATRTEVTGADYRNGRLRGVRTTEGEVEADLLVVACGVDTPEVARRTGVGAAVPLVPSSGVLAHTAPRDRLIERVVRAPGFSALQRADGRIVASARQRYDDADPTDDGVLREMAGHILEDGAGWVPELASSELERATLGWRPMPSDGHPIIGAPDDAPDVYLAVMHSGVTLAPFVGRVAATEILDEVPAAPLEPYRPSRFRR